MRLFLVLLLACSAGFAGPPVADAVAARAERRARLARYLGKDYGLVLGQPFTDVFQPGQEGHFLFLTGVTDPGASVLLAGEKARPLVLKARQGKRKTREVLYLRGESAKFAQFVGLRHQPGRAAEAELGIETTRAAPRRGDGLAKQLEELLPRKARLHVPGYRGLDHGLVREIKTALVTALQKSRPDVKIVDLHAELRRMRAVKDGYEIAALTRAVSITLEAFRDALPYIRPGSSEAAVDGALIMGVRKRGARPAYTFVVGAGPHSTIPHYFRNEAPLDAGDLLVIDAGAAFDRYAADVTRTFPVSGKFTQRQREVYEIVLRAQVAGIAAVKPGATMTEVDRAARSVIAKAGLGKYFIHGTSHHVGLDVHDPGPRKLAPGMTITVEPGVYIAKEEIGIRIEDVVLVTEQGHRVLSADFPKEPDAIEALLSDR